MSIFRSPDWVKKHAFEFSGFDDIPNDLFDELKRKFHVIHRSPPVASVVVIAYNEEKNLLRSISSLADQRTSIPYEVIVVNNNSKDKTQEVIDRAGVKTVLEINQGPGYARQAGLKISRGIYQICGDADTIYPPTYVEGMVRLLKKKNTSGVFGTYSFITPEGKKRFSYAFYEFFRDIAVRMRSWKRPELAVGGACFAFYTKTGKEIGWRTDIRRGEDGSMLRALKKHGKVRFVQKRIIRAWTSPRTLLADGNFIQMVMKRIGREFRRFHEYFYKKKGEYQDLDKNRI